VVYDRCQHHSCQHEEHHAGEEGGESGCSVSRRTDKGLLCRLPPLRERRGLPPPDMLKIITSTPSITPLTVAGLFAGGGVLSPLVSTILSTS
jgi:hypothetical protein